MNIFELRCARFVTDQFKEDCIMSLYFSTRELALKQKEERVNDLVKSGRIIEISTEDITFFTDNLLIKIHEHPLDKNSNHG